MQLEKITVKGLFQHFDHVIPLNSQERVTIITAPNGYGKTVILRIIDAVFSGKLRYLNSLVFNSIEFKFDRINLNIERIINEDSTNLKITSSGKKDKDFIYDVSKIEMEDGGINLSSIDDYIPWLVRVDREEWHDEREGDIIDLDEVFDRYEDDLPSSFGTNKTGYPEWLNEIIDSINVHLILDQRLIQRSGLHNVKMYRSHHKRVRIIDTVEKYAEELSKLIKKRSVTSSEVTQKLDSSFPTRLLDKQGVSALSIDDLKGRLLDLKTKRSNLSKYGLIASDQHSDVIVLDEIKQEDTKVLTLYVGDTEKKLSVYDDLLQRIQLFSEILNEKRLSFKKICISRDSGFYFETDDGKPLKLTQLSSGEQHEVVLLYELIFRAKDNVLVLIDEPEISLHIAWQKEFLVDLKKIIELQNVTVIISTHSPQIINSNWDLTVNLQGEVKM